MSLHCIPLELARTLDFPEGSPSHGYEFMAPLDTKGRLDSSHWLEAKGACTVHRFWNGQPDEHGALIHRGNGSWALSYAPGDDDEPIFRFNRHLFIEGEYVTVTSTMAWRDRSASYAWRQPWFVADGILGPAMTWLRSITRTSDRHCNAIRILPLTAQRREWGDTPLMPILDFVIVGDYQTWTIAAACTLTDRDAGGNRLPASGGAETKHLAARPVGDAAGDRARGRRPAVRAFAPRPRAHREG